MNQAEPRRIGRYLLFGPIASGGMATVHLGRLVADSGFSRTVAIKRLHPQLAEAPEIAASLLDEARIVSRIQHPNVVPTLDLLTDDDEVLLVMEYVHGESLSRLLAAARQRGEPVPIAVVAGVLCGALHGLHAAHEARRESGEPLEIVHRDVSPENLLVGVDGASRLLDFGIAKAHGRLTTTRNGQLKGKIAYMAPEQLLCGEVTRRTDVFAAGIVLWEALTGVRLFRGDDEAALITAALEAPIKPPSEVAAHVPKELDALVLKALERHVEGRYATARELAIALEEATPLAPPREVGAWVERLASAALTRRAGRIAQMETASVTVAQLPAPAAKEARVDEVATRADKVATRADEIATPASLAAPIAGPVRARIVAALGAASIVVIALLWIQARPRPLSASETALSSSASPALREASAPLASSEASAPLASSEPLAVASPPRPPLVAEPSAAREATTPARSRLVTPARSGRASAGDPRRCSPPYTVDTNGVRHLRPECI